MGAQGEESSLPVTDASVFHQKEALKSQTESNGLWLQSVTSQNLLFPGL